MGLLREVRLELSYVAFAIGVFMTLLAILHYVLGSALPAALSSILIGIGNWIVWFVAVGPILTIGGGWYLLDNLRKRKEFEKLIKVPGKAHFVKNQARLEELAWYLPSDYYERLLSRKRSWKIKD